MQSSLHFFLLLFTFLPPVSPAATGNARIFTFKMHHRYSDSFKNWSGFNRTRSGPRKGSFEYYSELAHRDQVLRGRRLSDTDGQPLSFSDGNSTFRISSLGFLHYTTVELGTPGVKFMVALDTGSDLFWLTMYNPKESSTSKKVTCNNSLCAQRNRCLGTFSSCPYMVSYVSAQTSTAGILVEDILHLASEDSDQEFVKAYVTFGCGQVQSGSFLDIAAPNGLFGLGMEKISVPSILSREGLTADSFSMCFGHDGVGRISFGDKGSPDQEETPFNLNPSHPTYNITVAQVRVGTTSIDVDFTALFDSGTSFTYMVDPTYSRVSENFHLQAQDRRRPPDSRIPFEYCYDMSPDANASLIPSISLTMKGGGHFAVYDPIIIISTQSELVYCLAVVRSAELNIIGRYDVEDYRISPLKPHSSSVPPAVAAGMSSCSGKFFLLLILTVSIRSCSGFGTFGFDIHHRYSDPVKGVLAADGLPAKGSMQYYAVMAHRDKLIHHGRGLAAATNQTTSSPLTFFNGNDTYRISSLGYLHYANVSIGTPSTSYLVALDTGSNLLWLPCDCNSSTCVQSLQSSSGTIDLSIYSPSKSSTSENVTCNSTLCTQSQRNHCPADQSSCPYAVAYLSNGTASSGFYVEDVLHLVTDDTRPNPVESLLETKEVPIKAKPPSTSVTGHHGNVSRTLVGGTDVGLQFTSIFDSGTSFTYLNDPAYSAIAEDFNKDVNEKRNTASSDLPFEYCYDISPNQNEIAVPVISLVMQGGDYFNVTDPIVVVALQGGGYVYCLGLVKSGDVNIIGRYDSIDSSTMPISPSSPVPSATAVNPQATAGSGDNSSRIPVGSSSAGKDSSRLNLFACVLMMALIPFFSIV
ncbi:hypothetical protein Tsubulata_034701 [Turnera subulata]|uniref:Peptidase A1 domain-containing protein n=1 Tax=Turnera subulata TaxID=218843 RepID=A0A9Q0JCV3_9ROSI|nr:hypothetical protein Tsubulata_034701 [Turnera subulata]